MSKEITSALQQKPVFDCIRAIYALQNHVNAHKIRSGDKAIQLFLGVERPNALTRRAVILARDCAYIDPSVTSPACNGFPHEWFDLAKPKKYGVTQNA